MEDTKIIILEKYHKCLNCGLKIEKELNYCCDECNKEYNAYKMKGGLS